MTLQETLDRIEPVSTARLAAVQARLDQQTKPCGSLGRLEEFARRFVAISGRETVRAKTIFTFAGDHGVCAEGVSAFPRAVTPQMVLNFLAGGAAVNALARQVGAGVTVVDMGVDYDFPPHAGLLDRKIARGTANLALGPAMSRAQAVQALETGIAVAEECVARGIDLVGTGDMGIGNTTPSAAIAAVFTGLPVEAVTHRGTGIDDAGLVRKLSAISRALQVNRPDPKDPVDVLAKVGGFEIGGIAGLVLGCAALKLPVVVDGFISTAGALIAVQLHPEVRDYIFAAHQSVEVGHTAMLERIGQKPILDLQMRLGEGTGGALAMGLIEAALRGLREIATFDDAGVSRGSDA
ncbi:nicotinate-nucleotide--dimethylbenzimidazole phosphoribosyltransferase [Desulfuromonas carbonis]|uniref:nicotinate-nucleotide--dimethylbenzimidazole phosphoribosyltransferase n=1 Tax=Desulfuromonas sp. DDH964 TaxID=1823759 RepID=UPI00078E13A1|nr:nicotinate-nucleotide--dimethylbenzimidazole phosphoribosyltransferase [Desulfuromonas sp. DDH964]AMV73413.1 nicotinate-nucleotide--dimethylbenzimidazole phosphoribosyltransferase [Desulfuromonas sp. DDH964]